MNQRPTSTEQEAALNIVRRCFEAYGGDIAAWPAEKRAQFGQLAASDACAALRREAQALDGFLNAASAPQTDPLLKNRLAAQYVSPSPRRGRAGLFDLSIFAGFRPVPASAFACIAALGFTVGVMTNQNSALPPEWEAYAYLEETSVFGVEDLELWDVN